ncbi:DUF234 domain-containing protein [Nocardia sp. NPDC051981]|uniref:DUF234 domain-containing protein n=1 Tax=Nocardia sp. NPDC051981 TaxID=3155417 RepID=UPI00342DD220
MIRTPYCSSTASLVANQWLPYCCGSAGARKMSSADLIVTGGPIVTVDGTTHRASVGTGTASWPIGPRVVEVSYEWTTWRGRAVEPVIRESLLRLLPNARWPETEAVGGWWNRQNNPELDLIGADREPIAGAVRFIGSIKWLEDRPFDRHDYDALARGVLAVPGAQFETPLVAVSRSGVDGDLPVAAHWGPEDLLLRAWH